MIYIYIVLFYLVNGLPQNLFEGFVNALNPETNGLARAALAPLNFLPSSSSGSPPGVDLKQFDDTLNGNVIDPSLETLSTSTVDLPANTTDLNPEMGGGNATMNDPNGSLVDASARFGKSTDGSLADFSVGLMKNDGSLLDISASLLNGDNALGDLSEHPEENVVDVSTKFLGENLNHIEDFVDMATNLFGKKGNDGLPEFTIDNLAKGNTGSFNFRDFFGGLTTSEQAKLKQEALNANELSSPTSPALANTDILEGLDLSNSSDNPTAEDLMEEGASLDSSKPTTKVESLSSMLGLLNPKSDSVKGSKNQATESLSSNSLADAFPSEEPASDQSNIEISPEAITSDVANDPTMQQDSTKKALELKEMVESDSNTNQDVESNDSPRKPSKTSGNKGAQTDFRGKQKRPRRQRGGSYASRKAYNDDNIEQDTMPSSSRRGKKRSSNLAQGLKSSKGQANKSKAGASRAQKSFYKAAYYN
ncbi:hypothetical protein DSO57_1011224 [Entomophthora muscae]|uniref:Uncharacterized protein n=1 Tax=Entomophthora muscae TaxID=34485 RepID=A0ACC2S884_9FUNG|nr:hypothetical protein DSO57_1011224 [Entomophthora muscae]